MRAAPGVGRCSLGRPIATSSKLAASQELRKMLNIGRSDDRNDVAKLSDAELIAQLSDTAKELGIEINLNYSFAQPKEPLKRSAPPEILEPQRR
jgi:hypothetical protein